MQIEKSEYYYSFVNWVIRCYFAYYNNKWFKCHFLFLFFQFHMQWNAISYISGNGRLTTNLACYHETTGPNSNSQLVVSAYGGIYPASP